MKLRQFILMTLAFAFTASMLLLAGFYMGAHSVPLYHFDNGGQVTIGCTK